MIDYESRAKKVIVNDVKELQRIYRKNCEKNIFIGFNNRGYDNVIFKSLLLGMNPKESMIL